MALHRDTRDQDQLLERTEGKLRGGNETSTDHRSALAANMQNVEALTKPNGTHPKATKAQKQELKARKDRALSIRRQYPNMKDIPTEISKQQKRRLIQKHEQEQKAMGLSRELPGGTSNTNQLAKPKKHGATKGKKKGSAEVKTNLPTSSRTVPTNVRESNIASISAANQASRPTSKVHKRAPREPPRKKQHGTSQNPNVVSQLSNKMAPLSDARRAEVVRNLKGLTHSDPINVD